MDTLQRSIARRLAAGALCLGAGACAGIEPRDELESGVERLAERLVLSARERADLRQTRVWVAEIHETRPATTPASMRDGADDVVALRLQRELMIALATRLNVFAPEGTAAGPRAAPAGRGATHVLEGDYVRQRDTLQITLQLIDAESRLIVAAARGAVGLAEVGLTDLNRWARNTEKAGTVAVSAAASTPIVVRPGPVAAAPAPGGAAPRVATAQASAAARASPAPAPEAAAPPPKTGTPAAPIEDFETWRLRHQGQQETAAGETAANLDQEALARTDAAARARRRELADLPEENAQPFPWRQNPWLARLLGIQEESPRTAPR